jgi:hypothetical protein
VDLNLVFPIGHVVVVLKVLGDVLKVLIAASSGVLSALSFEDALLAVGKPASKDELGTEFSSSRTVGQGIHPMNFLGMKAVGAFSSEAQVAALGAAKPRNISTVKIVEMLLEVTLATKANRVAVKVTCRALVLFRRRCNQGWRGVGSDVGAGER